MTKRSPYIAVAVLCCFLAVATPAFAGSGWVLWGSSTNSDAPAAETWTIFGAYGSENACEVKVGPAVELVRAGVLKQPAMAELSIETGRDWAEVTAMKPEWTKPLIMTFRYMCLPDTIDPRGPKVEAGMTAATFILWLVFTGGSIPPESRPQQQFFNSLDACLKAKAHVEENMKDSPNIRKLNNMGQQVRSICLPAGTRP